MQRWTNVVLRQLDDVGLLGRLGNVGLLGCWTACWKRFGLLGCCLQLAVEVDIRWWLGWYTYHLRGDLE